VASGNKDAVYHLKKSLEINPRHLPSLILLCKNYIKANEVSFTNECLDKIQQIDPCNIDLWFLRSKLALEDENFLKAKEHIDNCLKNKVYEKRILNLALNISSKLSDIKFRIAILEIYVNQYDNDGIKYLELAKCLQEPNQYERASYYFEVARNILPYNQEVLLETARFYSHAKKETSDGSIITKVDLEKSKSILEELLQSNQNYYEAICLLGEIEFTELNLINAKFHFLRCYDVNFKKSNYILKLAYIAKSEKDDDSQEKLLIEASSHLNTKPQALLNLFNLYLIQRDFLKASAFGIRAILTHRRLIVSSQKEIHKNLKSNNFIKSQILSKNLKVICNEISGIYFNYSKIKRNSNLKMKCIDKCLVFNPNHPDANYLTALELKKENNNQCVTFFKKCIDNNWEHWKARWEYITMNDPKLSSEEMVGHLQMIIECNPNHAKAIKLLSEIRSSYV
jgi:tetratricopeptide (TPR) repeat protein